MTIPKLKGLSGCELHLVDNHLIRKLSATERYNHRLRLQMEKQMRFSKDKLQSVYTPTVLFWGFVTDQFYFDMEYIDGTNFVDEFNLVSRETLDEYVTGLIQYIKEINTNTDLYSSDEINSLVKNKLESLRSNSKFVSFIDYILDTTQCTSLPKGICHGDLTLANMLFLNNSIYVIDFLDSYIESYVMDLIKLKQDLYYHWHLHLWNVKHSVRIQQICKYIWTKLESEFPVVFTDTFAVLDVINLLRIEPYLRTETELTLLQNIIQKTLLYAKFNSSHDGKIN